MSWDAPHLANVTTFPALRSVLARALPDLFQRARLYERPAALLYGATVRPSGDTRQVQTIEATDGEAFAVANPTDPRDGCEILLDIWNTSTGTMGDVTFGDQYALDGTFVKPATGFHAVYGFLRMPGMWREVSRSIHASEGPTASFTFARTGLAVDFTDTSTGPASITGWDWDFGDTNTSTTQNPSHTYALDGTYQVSLTVTDSNAAQHTTVRPVAVSAADPTLGRPFGPFALWATTTTIQPNGTSFFNSGPSPVTPATLVARIDAAVAQGIKLIIVMTGGSKEQYKLNGVFDRGPNWPTNVAGSKWANKMDTFDTPGIVNAVAAAVTNGSLIGALMFDEPSNAKWFDPGTTNTLTKAVIDKCHDYARSIFPTLPFGVSGRYDWLSSTSYTKVDFTNHQYSWRRPDGDPGNVTRFRDEALAQGVLDGVVVTFSMNVRAGGFKCLGQTQCSPGPGASPYFGCPRPLTGGPGTSEGDGNNCAMTGAQIEEYGLVLGPAGQLLTLWEYSEEHFTRTDWQAAFNAIADDLSVRPFTGLLRP